VSFFSFFGPFVDGVDTLFAGDLGWDGIFSGALG
jgi:hypothetical protein